jgi:agmatine/peptidylarginine deiminase
MKNTLLHEMIHAYVFLRGGNTDRDGHGRVFTRIMCVVLDSAQNTANETQYDMQGAYQYIDSR